MITLYQVLANRFNKIDEMAKTKEVCPICQGQNAKCVYFLWKKELDKQTINKFDPGLEQFRQRHNIKKLFLEEVKEKLVGEKVMFPIGRELCQVDLGNELTVNFIHLNLGDSFKEITLLDMVGSLFGLKSKYTPERPCSVDFAAIPVIILQPQWVISGHLDEVVQESIFVRYKAARDAVNQVVKKDWYTVQCLELISV